METHTSLALLCFCFVHIPYAGSDPESFMAVRLVFEHSYLIFTQYIIKKVEVDKKTIDIILTRSMIGLNVFRKP